MTPSSSSCFNITKAHLAVAAAAASAGHRLVTIFRQVIDDLGLGREGVDCLKRVITDGGVDMTNPADVAALDSWCLHRYNFSTPEQEQLRTELYLHLVSQGYPAKWHGALVNEIDGYHPSDPVPLFHGLVPEMKALAA